MLTVHVLFSVVQMSLLDLYLLLQVIELAIVSAHEAVEVDFADLLDESGFDFPIKFPNPEQEEIPVSAQNAKEEEKFSIVAKTHYKIN